jgi:hypothetical protein
VAGYIVNIQTYITNFFLCISGRQLNLFEQMNEPDLKGVMVKIHQDESSAILIVTSTFSISASGMREKFIQHGEFQP